MGSAQGGKHHLLPGQDARRIGSGAWERRSTMILIRRDSEIYGSEGGWFHARWHFSFGHYSDPENDGFGAMRVFNDDRLVAGATWPLHPHRDVEGITYVVGGAATVDDRDVSTGDAAKVIGQPELRIRARKQSELILVDVPMEFQPVGIWRGRI